MSLTIRSAADADCDAIWEIFREVIAAGDTYPIDPGISRETALAYWFHGNARVYVAKLDRSHRSSSEPNRQVVGCYTLHSNQAGGGGHVANAAFIVSKSARGQGVGRAMGEHCFAEAHRLGFKAMQFNFVVSTNEAAVKLWQDLGMTIVGTLAGAFRHPTRGYVDVYVMYQEFV